MKAEDRERIENATKQTAEEFGLDEPFLEGLDVEDMTALEYAELCRDVIQADLAEKDEAENRNKDPLEGITDPTTLLKMHFERREE